MYKQCIAAAFLAVAAAKPNIGYSALYPPYYLNSLYPQAAAYSVPEYPASVPITYVSQPLPVAPVPVAALGPQAYTSTFMYSSPSPQARAVAAPVAPVKPAAAPVTAQPAYGAGMSPYFDYGFGPSPYWTK